MKQKLLLLLSILALYLPAQAQPPLYGNEWIDPGKTYFKFKVGADGALRIPRSVLDAAGLPSTVKGSNFILYREGLEVPLLASAEVMTASDYLEFWGRKSDGKFDRSLYVTPSAQPDSNISLFTDTASYYLTWDAAAGHARYTDATAPIPATPGAPVAYCMATVATHFHTAFLSGATYDSQYIFVAADFDQAEGYIDAIAGIPATQQYTLATPNVLTTAPVAASVRASVLTQSANFTHEAVIKLNNAQIADSSFGQSVTEHFTIGVPAAGLQASNTISIAVTNTGGGPSGVNRSGTSYLEIVYPRNYDVSGLSSFNCIIPAAATAQYVEFLNFSGAQPRLYDSVNRTVYTGDVSVAGKVRFYLQPSLAARPVLLYSAAAVPALAVDKKISFQNFGAPALQASYVIITNKALRQGSQDYVQDYAAYRASAAGGSYTTTITDVADLYDAFAYGYDIHPLAIQNYLRFAYDNWAAKPQYVNIIGRGILYSEYPAYRAAPASYNFPIVPTYGDPGSDVAFVNWGAGKEQKIAIGRVSVWNAVEIGNYLQKVKGYEAALKPDINPTTTTEFWKKRALHIASGADGPEQDYLEALLAEAAPIIADTLTGDQVFTASNTSLSHGINPLPSALVDSLINAGIHQLTYFGHASPSGFGYALNDLRSYHNGDKLPYFLALGCDVSQMFALNLNKTISEQWMLKTGGGAIAVMASDNLGYPPFLSPYLNESYANIAYKSYGATLGQQAMNTYNQTLAVQNAAAYEGNLTQLENLIFAGDPAARLYSNPKPDYHIPSDELAAIPGNVSISTDSFRLRINAYNLARAIHDSVLVEVKHKSPAGNISTVHKYYLRNLLNTHTDYVWVPVDKLKDVGLNTYTVTIDADNKIDESNENNNTGTFTLFIYSDNLVPVYPKEFAIVYQQGVTLKASTLNPFRPSGRYRLQLDTTMRFNSPLKQETVMTSPGGVIKWKPALQMQDSVVYYWRAAFDSIVGGDLQWSASSFVYLAQGSPGWNQSHYYQFARDGYDNVTLDSDRTFRYKLTDYALEIHNTIGYNGVPSNPDLSVFWRGYDRRQGIPQTFTGMIIGVIDSVSGKWWMNDAANTAGAYPPVVGNVTRGHYEREFETVTPASRHAAARYLDSIPAGNYVFIKNTYYAQGISAPIFINDWKADTSIYGAGQSLYHAVKRLGFNTIDSFTSPKVFVFLRRKGDAAFPVTQAITGTFGEKLDVNTFIPGYDTHGNINSTVIGPSNKWESLKWKTFARDGAPQNDSVNVSIYGIDSLGAETYLCCRDRGNNRFIGVGADTSLDFISAKRYPNIRLVWSSVDSITNTPPQASFWRVLYSPVPEAALNPAAYLVWSDSLHQGQTENFAVAIENLTDLPMDSMLVRYKILDANGNAHLLANKRYRPLPGNDTLHATLSLDPAPYAGSNNLFVEANPDGDQREQYHPNNLGYLPLKVVNDKSNPLLDVTFDGQHILDGDIVSARPLIRILLKDENPYLPLNDTSMMTLSIHFPTDTGAAPRLIPFDGLTAKFIPATVGPNGKNEAIIEYRPTLDKDGPYELFVTGKDRSGNTSGLPQGANALASYKVDFEIFNKPTISNVLNYPNPFSTSTAFIFTLTGAQIPAQFKIQILTVTGKVVREITKGELGPLHIGRNITEYKWDGKDQYGQRLGNGVYMYRVATSVNGNNLERFEGVDPSNPNQPNNDGAGSNVDKYFKNGWGKMYIMR